MPELDFSAATFLVVVFTYIAVVICSFATLFWVLRINERVDDLHRWCLNDSEAEERDDDNLIAERDDVD